MSNVSNISIDEIIIEKKPRKQRMSKIVQKAVLLKQLSDRDLVPTLPHESVAVVPTAVPTVVPTAVPTVVPTVVEAKRKNNVKNIKSRVVEPVPTGVCIRGSTTVPTYTCELCNITFTSQTLFTRHPQTIRHKNKVKGV